MELHFLKIIWGDIIMLKSGNEVALIDTGYDKDFDGIKEYLDALGIKEIAFILLTHFHRDHYGSIPALLDAFKVGRVYFKEYSGLDSHTSWGAVANDEYRKSELDKCAEMKRLIEEKSTFISAEATERISFAGHEMRLFHTANTVSEVYEDETCPDFYHKIMLGENHNSLAVFMKVNGANVFLGGDISDAKSTHPKCDRVNTHIAQKIGEQIDVYKVPHHGTGEYNSSEALDIYKPKIAVITNHIGYLSKESSIFEHLKHANPDVRILLTEMSPVVIEISDEGQVTVKRCDDLMI